MAEELKTVTLEDVEILRVGTFNAARGGRQTFTAEDLAEFAAAHEALVESGHIPTVYLGHTQPEGSELPEPPAVGRIAALKVKGDRLLATLTDVPPLVAKLAQAKAYGTRSIEGMRTSLSSAVKIGEKTYRQVITGLALLGKSLPAVNGLADVEKLYAADGDDQTWVEVPLQMANGDDVLDRVLAAVDALSEGVEELIKGRAFAPAIRQRLRMLKTDLRRFAAPTALEASMEDKNAADVALAGPTDAATAMAVIAEILGIPDGEPAAIVARVRELAGGGTAAAADTAPEGTAMSSTINLAALQAEHTSVLQRLAAIEGERARDAAVARVDAEIKAGKFVPAQRETLVALALSDLSAFDAFAGASPAGVAIALGEKGTAVDTDAAAFEPTQAELEVAMKMGLSRDNAAEMLRRHKRESAR